MKITCKKTGKDMTSNVIQMLENDLKSKGFKIKKKDIFEKNMNNQELHQTWVNLKNK